MPAICLGFVRRSPRHSSVSSLIPIEFLTRFCSGKQVPHPFGEPLAAAQVSDPRRPEGHEPGEPAPVQRTSPRAVCGLEKQASRLFTLGWRPSPTVAQASDGEDERPQVGKSCAITLLVPIASICSEEQAGRLFLQRADRRDEK